MDYKVPPYYFFVHSVINKSENLRALCDLNMIITTEITKGETQSTQRPKNNYKDYRPLFITSLCIL
jgi:hypothetical protein